MLPLISIVSGGTTHKQQAQKATQTTAEKKIHKNTTEFYINTVARDHTVHRFFIHKIRHIYERKIREAGETIFRYFHGFLDNSVSLWTLSLCKYLIKFSYFRQSSFLRMNCG